MEWGLIGPREVGRLWDRHILNCIGLSGMISAGTSVADVGSGAGLPGLPLAILRPDLEITLIEPLLRRSTFLNQAVAELGLTSRVQVVRARAEDHRARYDIVTARAVAPLSRLVGWCAPLRSPSGAILALKGRTAADEVDAASAVLRDLGLTAEILSVQPHPDVEPATVVRVASRR